MNATDENVLKAAKAELELLKLLCQMRPYTPPPGVWNPGFPRVGER